MSVPQDMLEKAKLAMQKAYAPYSQFSVGASLRDEHGGIHAGCNIENIAYGSTLCAETTAIGNLVSSGHQKIKEILVVFACKEICFPCGSCLQRLAEFATPDTLVHLCNADGSQQTTNMAALMPSPFQPQLLGKR